MQTKMPTLSSWTRVRKLERKLEENKIKEQEEAQDLEAMVQHVEKNLQLMTVNISLFLLVLCHDQGWPVDFYFSP